ncbi:hypothetical protein R1flu_026558 [Riccia fluitans]|uniref:Uncharacterized protein n=1 Tax=Riccia fluitans TaxID=41844 RepID=A0ABD1XG96_9MARC
MLISPSRVPTAPNPLQLRALVGRGQRKQRSISRVKSVQVGTPQPGRLGWERGRHTTHWMVRMETKAEQQQKEEPSGTSDDSNPSATTEPDLRHVFISDIVSETAMLWLERRHASKADECSTAKDVSQQEADPNRQIQLEDVESPTLPYAKQDPGRAEQDSAEILQEQHQLGGGFASESVATQPTAGLGTEAQPAGGSGESMRSKE